MFQTLLKAGADGLGKMVDLIKDSSKQALRLILGTLNIADIMVASWRSVSIHFSGLVSLEISPTNINGELLGKAKIGLTKSNWLKAGLGGV